MQFRWALAALTGFWLASAPATAAPVTHYFGGTITVNDTAGLAALSGQAFSGTFTYDPATRPDERRSTVHAGALQVRFADGSFVSSAESPAALSQGWNTSFGTILFSGKGDIIRVFADVGSATQAATSASVISLLLYDANDDAGFGVPGDALPGVLDLSKLEGAEFALGEWSPFRLSFAAGLMNCLSTSPTACALEPPVGVAEPGALSLAGLALLGLVGVQRRRRQHGAAAQRT